MAVTSPSVTVLQALPIGSGVKLARIVRAGRWVFAQGNIASLHAGGIVPDVTYRDPLALFATMPSFEQEATFSYENLIAHLDRVGGTIDSVVRLDQYYPTTGSVDAYHTVRKKTYKRFIPPSTSVVMRTLLHPDANIEFQALALLEDPDSFVPVHPTNIPKPPTTSGFVPALRAGGFVFVAGQMATEDMGVPPEATMGPLAKWAGREIKLQARYTLKNIVNTLEAAGVGLDRVVKAQVYVTDISELPYLDEVWREFFGERGPARVVVPTADFGARDGIIEINVLAAEEQVSIETLEYPRDVAHLSVEPAVVVAGDLVFLSGAMAIRSGEGLCAEVKAAEADPFTRSAAEVEIGCVIDRIEADLARAGLGLGNLTRIIQFHTDLADFLPMARVWQARLGAPVPLTAVQVPAPLAVPGARVLVDCWAVR
jgi:2-iminobutanoate/2-iminopropanoate deaminase